MGNILGKGGKGRELFERGTWKLIGKFGPRENSCMSMGFLGCSIKFCLLCWLEKKV